MSYNGSEVVVHEVFRSSSEGQIVGDFKWAFGVAKSESVVLEGGAPAGYESSCINSTKSQMQPSLSILQQEYPLASSLIEHFQRVCALTVLYL